MTNQKPILIIFEGADDAGKTSTARKLCEASPLFKILDLPKKTIFMDNYNQREKVVIDDAQSLTLFIKLLEFLPKNEHIWVMDRSIHSNLIYGCRYLQWTHEAISMMNDIFDIRMYILDRDLVTTDFRDDNLDMKRDNFNEVIKAYREYGLTERAFASEKIFRTRLVQDGVFDNLKQEQLINSIMLSV